MKWGIVDREVPSLLDVVGIVQSHDPNTGRIFRYKDSRMHRLRRQWGSTIPRCSVTGRHPAGLAWSL